MSNEGFPSANFRLAGVSPGAICRCGQLKACECRARARARDRQRAASRTRP